MLQLFPMRESTETLARRESYWPKDLPRSICVPKTSIFENLVLSAQRYPDNVAVHYFGTDIGYTELLQLVERFAGWLQYEAKVAKGDRVLLYMQNSPQWLIAYYGILRADAVVVPVNPMNRTAELRHYAHDSGARVAVVAQDLVSQLLPAISDLDFSAIVTATYSDYLPTSYRYNLPDWVTAEQKTTMATVPWKDIVQSRLAARPHAATADDISALIYTSGSTGVPKGCMLTHRACMHNIVGQALWHWTAPGTRFLASSPMFHVAGLNHGVHAPIYVGGTSVVLPRWDRSLAMQLIESQAIGHATIPPTAVSDLLSAPDFDNYDLTSLRRLTAGGSAMPHALANRLHEKLGLEFIEAYGLTETAATTHLNPITRPKRGSLGIPIFDTHSIVVDPETLCPVKQGEPGEILISGPQMFNGYWNLPQATAETFVDVGGKRYLRTGDIGYIDEEGYFFMTDRAKRMINASGYKVWPAELERVLSTHPAVRHACVVGIKDAYRGESVKAVIVREDGHDLSEAELITWMRERVAAYKCPRSVRFVDSLPKSDIGKTLWREVQEAENQCSDLNSP